MRFFLMLLCLRACVPGLCAPDPPARRAIEAEKATVAPAIDGDLSDPLWAGAARAEAFSDRVRGTAEIDQTVAWIAYDDQHIYVAFHCRDIEPDRIVARETVRDQKYLNEQGGDSEDYVEVVFDAFLTRRFEDFTRFSVNALGTPSARLGGGRAAKAEWKGDWLAAAKRLPDGWAAEMRIPWKILNYPSSRQPLDMGINFRRFQERVKIESEWSNTGPQRHTERMGIWRRVQPPAAGFEPSLSFLPYTLPGWTESGSSRRFGLDARFTATPELTAVGSINPDFATIEGAVESIQFSRSEQFLPERRPFFLEGESYFTAGKFYSIGHYFFSRRIPSFDAGTKVYGKASPKDTLGILNAVDIRNRSDTVLSYRRDFSPTSFGNLFITQKSSREENNNLAVLLQETRWGKFSVESELALTSGTGAGGGARQIGFGYGDKHNYWFLQYQDISPLFRNPNGLTFFTDRRGFLWYSNWTAQWRKGFWRSFSFDFFPEYTWHQDGRPFTRGVGAYLMFETRSDWRFSINPSYSHYEDQIDSTWTFRMRSGASNRFRQWGASVSTGRQADRPYTFIGPDGSIRLFGRLDITYGGAIQNFEGRRHQHVASLSYELSPTRSFGGRLVIQDSDTNWYLSYRNSGARGTETYFIVGDPNSRRFTRQTLCKLVFAL